MGDFSLAPAAISSTARRWADASEMMAETSRALSGASTSALAPGVRDAAQRFLTAWSGYAGESEEIARGLDEGLREVSADVRATDARQSTDFADLDSRLGPAL